MHARNRERVVLKLVGCHLLAALRIPSAGQAKNLVRTRLERLCFAALKLQSCSSELTQNHQVLFRALPDPAQYRNMAPTPQGLNVQPGTLVPAEETKPLCLNKTAVYLRLRLSKQKVAISPPRTDPKETYASRQQSGCSGTR